MPNYWQQSFTTTSDLTIIGAGLTGLFSALAFRQKHPRASIRIFEAGPYPDGASIRNAGFACYGSPSEILDDISREGREKALQRVMERYAGLRKLREICPDQVIDYQPHGGYEVFTEKETDACHQVMAALPDLNAELKSGLGFVPFAETKNSFGFNTLPRLVHIAEEGALHSGKLLRWLVAKVQQEGIEMHWNTRLKTWESENNAWRLKTTGASYKTAILLLCTNAYTGLLLPELPIQAHRGQILRTSALKLAWRGNFHLDRGYYYFRPVAGGVLLGGGRHLFAREEATTDGETTEKLQNALEALLRNTILPGHNWQVAERWAGHMAFGPNNEKEPLLRELAPKLWVAARLGGMGVAMVPRLAERVATDIN